MRGRKNGVIFSYLHYADNKRIVPPYSGSLFGNKEMHQVEFLRTLMSRGKIFQNNKDFSCWYDLNGPDRNDDKTFLIIIDVKELNTNYTPLHSYVLKKIDTHLLIREIEQPPSSSRRSRPRRPRSNSPIIASGGKTRRKCKVKKRRNRRRRNTMKRRKTTAKRRYR